MKKENEGKNSTPTSAAITIPHQSETSAAITIPHQSETNGSYDQRMITFTTIRWLFHIIMMYG